MIAVCPLTTRGAPPEEAKEPAIAQIPKPTAPTPADSFNPFAIMAYAPIKMPGRLHHRLPTIAGRASAGRASVGHVHAFHLLPFVVRANQITFGLVGFNVRCAEYSEHDAQFFVIITLLEMRHYPADHAKGMEHSKSAQQHSQGAGKQSDQAHAKSQQLR